MAELGHLVGGELVEVGPDGVFWGGGGFSEGDDELEEEVLLLLHGAAGADVGLQEEEVVLERLASDEVVDRVDVREEDLDKEAGAPVTALWMRVMSWAMRVFWRGVRRLASVVMV